MRRLVADKVAYDYVAGLREVSHKYADLLGGIGGLKAGDVELAVGIAKDHAVPGKSSYTQCIRTG